MNGVVGVCLSVQDMDRALAWYEKMLGCVTVFQTTSPRRIAGLTLGDETITVIENAQHPAGVMGFSVKVDDIQASVEDLRAKGAEIALEPIAAGNGMLAIVKDADGIAVSLNEPFDF